MADFLSRASSPSTDGSFKKYQRIFRGAVGRGFSKNIFKPLISRAKSQLVFDDGRIKLSKRTGTARRVCASGMSWVIERNRSGSWTCQCSGGSGNTAMALRSEDVTPCAMWIALQARLHPTVHLKISAGYVDKRRGGSVASRTRAKRVRGERAVSVRRVYNTRSRALSRAVGK